MRDLIGRTLGHYRIVDKIGEGGMGEVYRAHDERLDRDVAVKVLPGSVAQDPERIARFEREAKAVAKLEHPNILAIYDFGTDDDVTYSVTELLGGETLRERLEDGGLGWRKAAEVGAFIADGLAAAHGAGIIHRDLKPDNVFLTSDGRVKTLDFGLARDVTAATPDETHSPTVSRYTDPGAVMGTAGYMSPEQVRGESADARSDIFSLGSVLYEMTTGRRAFARDTAAETMTAILKEEPSDISSSGVEAPPELAGTIRRCLEKRPQARFQSASDLAYNLRTISSASTPSAAREAPLHPGRKKVPRWIAVAAAAVIVIAVALTAMLRLPRDEGALPSAMGVTLEWVAVAPFENRTGDASLDPLGLRAADLVVQRFSEVGMSDGILTLDAAPYPPGEESQRGVPRRRDSGVQPVGAKGPHVLVSGSYYLDGEELEFQARLTDYETGELLYAFKPISAIQLEAAQALNDLRELIVAAVGFHWSSDFDLRVDNPPSSYAALRTFDRGWKTFGVDSEESIAACEETLEIDPSFDFPRFTLVSSYWNIGDRVRAERELSALKERQADLTVFEQAFFDACSAAFARKRFEALSHVRQMVRIAPHYGWSRNFFATAAMSLNRPRETLEVLGPLLPPFEGEPREFSWWVLDVASDAHHALAEYEQQLELANVGLELFPDVGHFFVQKGSALAAMGSLDAIDAVIDQCTRVQLRESARNAGEVMYWTALELRTHGQPEKSDQLATRAVEWFEHRAAALDLSQRDLHDLWQHSRALRVAGRWEEARTLQVESKKRAIEERGYVPIGVVGNLGVIAARTGDHEEAWRILNEFPESHLPSFATDRFYERACIAAHLGEKDLAVELLREGYANGLSHKWSDHIDVDLEPLWDYPPFQELIEPKG